MNEHDLSVGRIKQLREAHKRSTMVGWDFSRLDGLLDAENPPWDFEHDCELAMLDSSAIVDLGTGGGERLLRLLDRLAARGVVPNRVAATEGWEPNVKVAREALSPRGIDVFACDPEAGDRVPCNDETFDLAMNRHEAIDTEEIARILMPGGRFLTQQVHGLDVPEFREWFGSTPQYPHVTPDNLCRELEKVGLVVETVDDWSGAMALSDAEALVTYLSLVPWYVPEDFSVDAFSETLLRLDSAPIRVTQRRFRVYAVKPQ